MFAWWLRWKMRRTWPRCSCGVYYVAPGTRTEIGGVSHGDTPCYYINTYGDPI